MSDDEINLVEMNCATCGRRAYVFASFVTFYEREGRPIRCLPCNLPEFWKWTSDGRLESRRGW